MDNLVNLFTRIILSLGLSGKVKFLINGIIDVAIQEGKEEIDTTTMFSDEEKIVAKNGIDVLAARLKTLINERM